MTTEGKIVFFSCKLTIVTDENDESGTQVERNFLKFQWYIGNLDIF